VARPGAWQRCRWTFGHPWLVPVVWLHLQRTPNRTDLLLGFGEVTASVAASTTAGSWGRDARLDLGAVAALVVVVVDGRGRRCTRQTSCGKRALWTCRCPPRYSVLACEGRQQRAPPRRTENASGGVAARSLVGEGPPCAFPSGRCIASLCPTAKRFRRGRIRARGRTTGGPFGNFQSSSPSAGAPATQTLFLDASGGVARATGE